MGPPWLACAVIWVLNVPGKRWQLRLSLTHIWEDKLVRGSRREVGLAAFPH